MAAKEAAKPSDEEEFNPKEFLREYQRYKKVPKLPEGDPEREAVDVGNIRQKIARVKRGDPERLDKPPAIDWNAKLGSPSRPDYPTVEYSLKRKLKGGKRLEVPMPKIRVAPYWAEREGKAPRKRVSLKRGD